MFYHATAYYYLAQKIIALYGESGCHDGDMFVANHPYEALHAARARHGAHGADPRRWRAVAFSAAIAHKADIGGTVPGSSWGQAVELFQEGLHCRPCAFMRRAFSTPTWSA